MLLILVVCETIYCLSHRVTLITGPVLLSLMGLSPHPSLTWLCIYNYHSWKCGFFPHDSVDHSLIWLHIHIPHKRFFLARVGEEESLFPWTKSSILLAFLLLVVGLVSFLFVVFLGGGWDPLIPDGVQAIGEATGQSWRLMLMGKELPEFQWVEGQSEN